ncbi:hypothetical protein HUG17_9168 [Dermatophagoides farinae]|uniref:Uncharacterized protein n=1 Tax=Dermatophagoides farinae TaxID=6954 RepID=A0A9D4SDV6_DERFA|nr:hypothetical protein HUG17_9168 [Dermatophagoides farinae]
MSSNSTLLSSSVTSNTSPTSTSLSTATEITTDVNVCRFCLHSAIWIVYKHFAVDFVKHIVNVVKKISF